MQLFFFARFHVRSGGEGAAEEALLAVLAPTRDEPGCLGINAFRSTQDARLFIVHSRWTDEAAFELHTTLPHTVNFITRMESLLDHPAEFTRTEVIG